MVSKTSCVTAGVIHLIGAAFFVPQPQDQCSSAPKLGSLLFLLAALLFLGHAQVIPRRYMLMAPGIISFVELMFTVFVQEWLMHVLWCGMERFVHRMARIFCQNCLWCEYGVETLATLLMGLSALYVVIEVVCPAKVKAAVEKTFGRALDQLHINRGSGSFVEKIKDFRCYVRGAIFFFRLTREQRMLSVRVFEVQVERRKRGFVEARHEQQDNYQEIAAEKEEEPAEMHAPLESQKQGEAAEAQESSSEIQEPSSSTQNLHRDIDIESPKPPLAFLREEGPSEILNNEEDPAPESQDEPPFEF
ncbi:uncharacterized protein LOC111080412 [Drosophila obscura]|uniref:uncharacterized protein LOC111080412 n=1 Tax=Drosophila obscura TaxID=7282 RepID=UPI001BB2C9B9|nr:uncharacterized protein LOC111080412 [Drosophila obscura]